MMLSDTKSVEGTYFRLQVHVNLLIPILVDLANPSAEDGQVQRWASHAGIN